jgi:MoxR-like ATPase
MNIKEFKQALPVLMTAKAPVLLWGPHGLGKTSVPRQYCQENNLEMIVLNLGNMETGDLVGLCDFETDSKGNKLTTKFMRPDWLPSDPNSKGILFLDEFNRSRREVLQAVFSLLLEGRIHNYHLPKGWYVMAAANPQSEDYIVTGFEDKAFYDRVVQVKFEPTATEWLSYARNKDLDNSIVNFIEEHPESLRTKTTDYDIKVSPSPRTNEKVSDILKASKALNLSENVQKELLFGMLGVETTLKFFEYTKHSQANITAEDILTNWKKIKDVVTSKRSDGSPREDIMKLGCDRLVEHFKEEMEKRKDTLKNEKSWLPKKQEDNLAAFCMILPLDMLRIFIRSLSINAINIAYGLDNRDDLNEFILPHRVAEESRISKENPEVKSE